jgi:hypothetical protein
MLPIKRSQRSWADIDEDDDDFFSKPLVFNDYPSYNPIIEKTVPQIIKNDTPKQQVIKTPKAQPVVKAEQPKVQHVVKAEQPKVQHVVKAEQPKVQPINKKLSQNVQPVKSEADIIKLIKNARAQKTFKYKYVYMIISCILLYIIIKYFF